MSQQTDLTSVIEEALKAQIEKLDIESLIEKIVSDLLTAKISKMSFNARDMVKYISEIQFPEESISAKWIKQQDLAITGEQIKGGIVANFSSTGLDDRASDCVITLMDEAVVVENNLLTKDLTVKGNLDIHGAIVEDSPFYSQLTTSITNSIKEGLNDELFGSFSRIIFDKIRQDGIDLTKITVDGKTVLEGTRIGFDVTDSNLQRVGLLKTLQVEGEAMLSNSLYTTQKRVGINTLEPGAALSVWDEEVEFNIGKKKQGHAQIGTPRAQTVTLSSNNKNNIVLNTDGSVKIDDLHLDNMRIGTANSPPTTAGTKGHILFNSNPTLGAPLGWICLGSTKWANFGVID